MIEKYAKITSIDRYLARELIDKIYCFRQQKSEWRIRTRDHDLLQTGWSTADFSERGVKKCRITKKKTPL